MAITPVTPHVWGTGTQPPKNNQPRKENDTAIVVRSAWRRRSTAYRINETDVQKSIWREAAKQSFHTRDEVMLYKGTGS